MLEPTGDGLQIVAVFHQPGERRRHESFSESNNIAQQDAAALFEMASGHEHGGALEREKFVVKLLRQFEAVLAFTRFL